MCLCRVRRNYSWPFFLVERIRTHLFSKKGTASANSVAFGECTFSRHLSLTDGINGNLADVLRALGRPPTPSSARFCAFFCLSFVLITHTCFTKWGVRLQNSLGFLKIFILSAIALVGILTLMEVPGFKVRDQYEKPDNFRWKKLWEDSGTGLSSFVAGLYKVLWCVNSIPFR